MNGYLVLSYHLIDNVPIGILESMQSARRAARKNHSEHGPPPEIVFPPRDIGPYTCTTILTMDDDGRPVACEQIGEDIDKPPLRIVPADAAEP